MSTLIALRRDVGPIRPRPRPDRPSVREVCLVGGAAAGGSAPDPKPQGETVRRSGRTYRVSGRREPVDSDPRGYLHLVVAPEFSGT